MSTYAQVQKEYPRHVVIRKEGYFYTAKGVGADVLNAILGYRFYTDKYGNVATGGPNLETIEDALAKNHINYIVMENDLVVSRKNFPDSDFPEGFVMPEPLPYASSNTRGERIVTHSVPKARSAHNIGPDAPEYVGRRILHKIPDYGPGTVQNAYYVDDEQIYVEIEFDNGRKANPFSLLPCLDKELLKFMD